MRRIWLVVLAVSVSVILAASPQDSSRPRRIVSLVPAVTEMLFAIGAGDEVVGVSSFDRYPPEVRTRTRLGALIDPDVERLLSLSPDLAVVYGTQNALIGRLTRAGVPMFSYEHAGLDDVLQTIRRLGARIGRRAEADRLVDRIRRDIATIRAAIGDRPKPETALVIGRELGALRGIYVSGGVGFLHDMLDAAGGTNAFADVERSNLQASVELLFARSPDVVVELLAPEGWTPESLARERSLWTALPGLPAVRNNRVHLIADDAVLVPGPRVAQGIRLMAQALHPGVVR